VYKLAANVVKVILKLMGSKARVYGEENLPKEGGFIIACTHTGYVDILNLGVAMYPREIQGLGWLVKHLNAFPVDRDNPGPSVIKIPSQLLKEGKIVGIFPSGTRSADGTDLKQGAITIAQLAKAQIVPAAYVGARNAGDVMKRGKGYLIYGEPFYVTGKGKEGREQFTQHLEHELVALTEELQKRIPVK